MAKERQPGRATTAVRAVILGEDPTDDVLVDHDSKNETRLFGDMPAAEARIAGLHLSDRRDEFGRRTFGARLTAVRRSEQPAVLATDQRPMKLHDCRGFQHDRATQQAGRVDPQRTNRCHDAVYGS